MSIQKQDSLETRIKCLEKRLTKLMRHLADFRREVLREKESILASYYKANAEVLRLEKKGQQLQARLDRYE